MRTNRNLYKRLGAALVVCACVGTATARAEEDAATRANRSAYNALIKCFVANGLASDERSKAGDSEKAAAYNAKARQSFDYAYVAGEKIGLNDKQVARDLSFVQDTELPKMIRDRQYFFSAAATCKALGLM